MNCFQHPDLDAVGVCSSCGKGVCENCAVEFQERMYCKDCIKKTAPVTSAPVEPRVSGAVRLSKGFYLGSIAGGLGVGFILMCIGGILVAAEEMAGAAIIFPGLAAVLYGAVVWFVLVYRMWRAIQDGHARTTPGKAVGFLFIPFFNFYWQFEAFWGFAKDCNQYIDRHNASATKLPEGLFLASCILTFVGFVPYLGGLAGIADVVIMIILVSKICDTVNQLPQPSLA